MKICKNNKMIILFIIINYLFTSNLYSQNEDHKNDNYSILRRQVKLKSKNSNEIFSVYNNDIYIKVKEIDSLNIVYNDSSSTYFTKIAIMAYFDVDTNGIAQEVKFDRLYQLSNDYLSKNKYNFYWEFIETKITQEMKNWKFKVDDENIERIRQISKNYGSDKWIFEGALICQFNSLMFIYSEKDNNKLFYIRNENNYINIHIVK